MTRKTRNLIVASAVLAALIVTVIVTNLIGEKPVEEDLASSMPATRNLTDVSPDSLRRVVVENPGGSMSLIKMDGGPWTVEGMPTDYRADDSLLPSVSTAFASLFGQVVDEDVSDYKPYGLDAPSAVLRLEDEDGNEWVVRLGSENPSKTQRYASRPGDTALYLLSSSRVEKAYWTPGNLRDRRLPAVDVQNIHAVTIKTGEQIFQTIPYETPADDSRQLFTSMEVVKPWKSPRPLRDSAFSELLTSSPPPGRIAGFLDVQPDDPRSLGFGPGSDGIRLEAATGEVYDLEIGVDAGEGRRYARQGADPDFVFLVASEDLGLLNLNPFSLTGKSVFLANIANIATIHIESGEREHFMDIEKLGDPDEDSDDLFRINGREVSEDDFKDVYQFVIGLQFEGVAEEAELTGRPELTIHYRYIHPTMPATSVFFHPYNQLYYLGVVGDEPAEFLVGRYQIQQMLQEIDEVSISGP